MGVRCIAPPSPPRCTCLGVCWQVGGRHPIIYSVGISCVLGGFNSPAVEAECLNVASGRSPYLLITFVSFPSFLEQSLVNEIIPIIEYSNKEMF